MPTLLRIFGLRFFFYLDEHLPIHVHVECGGKMAKIEIESEVRVVYNHGLKEQELRTAVDTCRWNHGDRFLILPAINEDLYPLII